MKYWIKRSVLPFGIVCLMSMALCGCGREKKEAVTVQPELVIGSDDYEPYNYQDEMAIMQVLMWSWQKKRAAG